MGFNQEILEDGFHIWYTVYANLLIAINGMTIKPSVLDLKEFVHTQDVENGQNVPFCFSSPFLEGAPHIPVSQDNWSQVFLHPSASP